MAASVKSREANPPDSLQEKGSSPDWRRKGTVLLLTHSSQTQNAMKKTTSFSPPTHEEIAAYAYHLWEAEGRISGRDLEYWFQAKAHLLADRLYEAGMLDQITPVLMNSRDLNRSHIPFRPTGSLPERSVRRTVRRPAIAREERAPV
jgi:hypothetical protein